MEHFRSTLATTAIAAFGLLAAAHILHPGNFEPTTYPSRPSATVGLPQAAWVNPPATLPTVAAQEAPVPVAWTSVTVPAEAPAAPVASPAKEHRHRVSAYQHRKMAQRAARLRQATLDAAKPAEVPAVAKPEAKRIDPIGDLIRGLGLGSDS